MALEDAKKKAEENERQRRIMEIMGEKIKKDREHDAENKQVQKSMELDKCKDCGEVKRKCTDCGIVLCAKCEAVNGNCFSCGCHDLQPIRHYKW